MMSGPISSDTPDLPWPRGPLAAGAKGPLAAGRLGGTTTGGHLSTAGMAALGLERGGAIRASGRRAAEGGPLSGLLGNLTSWLGCLTPPPVRQPVAAL
jgi:hypothetical protein